jgi:hypothetical protein
LLTAKAMPLGRPIRQRVQGDHANVSQNTINRGHHQGKG